MKTPKVLSGMNETASILFLLIVGVWFFTSSRFQAFLAVIKAPVSTALYTGPTETLPKDSPIPGLVVPKGVTPNPNDPNTHESLNPGAHNPTVKP